MFLRNAKMVSKLVLIGIFSFFISNAHADDCETMSEMAKDVANIRDAGVSLAALEARLKRDVADSKELAVGLIVARLVYKTDGTGQQLKQEILKNCKKFNKRN
jgi:hypothetical protein